MERARVARAGALSPAIDLQVATGQVAVDRRLRRVPTWRGRGDGGELLGEGSDVLPKVLGGESVQASACLESEPSFLRAQPLRQRRHVGVVESHAPQVALLYLAVAKRREGRQQLI